MTLNRRTFLLAGTSMLSVQAAPSDQVTLGVIGSGSRGTFVMTVFQKDPAVKVLSICDVFEPNLETAISTASKVPGTRPKAVRNYKELLADKDVEAVIIALPLHLHAPVAIKAMLKGKHVLVEKLMAHNVAQCKWMGRVSNRTRRLCSTGHQRHYSILYDNAVNLIRWGLLGQIHHIRAQWHRGNLPGNDTWAMPVPGGETYLDASGSQKLSDPIVDDIRRLQGDLLTTSGRERDMLTKKLAQWVKWDEDKTVDAQRYGYEERELAGRRRSAIEELVRWRIWERTGGGLMAELGSHQLDAASIFISAMSKDKVHPLTVHAVGGRHIFPADRDADDHVYCMLEFPGPKYSPDFKVGFRDVVNDYPNGGVPSFEEDPEKKVVVSYSSINGNGWGGYGEIVMGTKGTIVLETEQEYQLYSTGGPATFVDVTKGKDGALVLDTTASAPPASAVGEKALGAGPVSRGYTEEIEHWAFCIENNPDAKDPAIQAKCKPEVAMADAIIALTTNIAIRDNKRIEFKDDWFEIDNDETPEGEKPEEKV